MTQSWIIVANASNAKIYQAPRATLLNGRSHLKLVKTLTHPESRKKEGELTASNSEHGNIPESANPKLQEHKIFAKEIVNEIEEARKTQDFDDIIISAPAAFLGHMKQQMSNCVKTLISTTIEKDYTQCDESQLNNHIGDNLR